MGDVVNLNKFRKQKAKKEEEKVASSNRVLFGRTKHSKEIDKKKQEASRKKLDDLKIDPTETDKS
ncbi:DUF4169 family protein [Sneathiella aquimaris]|uniref:DUF4169 family protein n=1 Tax=Sneathiella aquimaris TaxID=2599305 RepID=UPI00146AEBBF|nr:DUF4169 family protein [Sneathiella aquimaris]